MLTLTITEPTLRIQLQKECQMDESTCCKRKSKNNLPQKSKSIAELKKMVFSDKGPFSSAEQKKAASYAEAQKAIKRIGSPVSVKKISSQPTQAILANLPPALSVTSPLLKKIAPTPVIPSSIIPLKPNLKPIRYPHGISIGRGERKIVSNTRKVSNVYQGPRYRIYNGTEGSRNCFPSYIPDDHLNLSLESLTQGIDVSNILQSEDDNLICTPDLPIPIEPVCEVTEDDDCSEVPQKIDDDVQCLTPHPKIMPKPLSALTEPRFCYKPGDMNPNNIIQMTDRDVTVNKETGVLKFRVDPATLSTSKMYQLPDGRVFAVNVNPKMPGGYSATIVSTNDSSLSSLISRPGLTVKQSSNTSSYNKNNCNTSTPNPGQNKSIHKWTTPTSSNQTDNISSKPPQEPTGIAIETNKKIGSKLKSILTRDVPPKDKPNVPSLEWYSYNLYDAIDLIEYVSKKLHKLKSSASEKMRNKTGEEVKELRYEFDQLLKISCQRLSKVKKNLNSEFKFWLKENNCIELFSDDEDEDDDKIEINSDVDSLSKPATISNEPIFIDENSSDSIKIDKFDSVDNSNKASEDKMPSKEDFVGTNNTNKEFSKQCASKKDNETNYLKNNRKRKISNDDVDLVELSDPLKDDSLLEIMSNNKNSTKRRNCDIIQNNNTNDSLKEIERIDTRITNIGIKEVDCEEETTTVPDNSLLENEDSNSDVINTGNNSNEFDDKSLDENKEDSHSNNEEENAELENGMDVQNNDDPIDKILDIANNDTCEKKKDCLDNSVLENDKDESEVNSEQEFNDTIQNNNMQDDNLQQELQVNCT